MCQLLAMNSRKPDEFGPVLQRFLRRGGETGEHADGWGIAYFEPGGCRLLLDEEASCRSPLARWVLRERLRSCNALAHIRKATQGSVEAFNCHPFLRALWGREWAFAHNGNLDLSGQAARFFRPVGQTDSERAFCLLLDGLLARFGATPPGFAEFAAELAALSRIIGAHGSFNYVLSDGRRLFAHCSTRLHFVQREAGEGGGADGVLVATEPVSDEGWAALRPGQLLACCEGRVVL